MKKVFFFILFIVSFRGLHAQHIQIYTSIEEALKDSDKVKRLSLDRNANLKSLPISIWKLKNLEEIDLEECPNRDINQVVDVLSHLTHLRSLWFAQNGLVSLPNEISSLTGLEKLGVTANKLTELPNSILQLKKLREIFVGENPNVKLPELFDLLSNLKSLKFLDLGDDHLSELPNNLVKLRSLDTLWLDGNEFISIPDVVKKMHLKSISLSSNKLATAELKKGDFPRLEFIDLNQNQFKSIPAALYAIVNLKRMMLWDNAIAFVPKGISRLKNLESLELQNNKLITIPLELTNLKKLECLDMEGNNLAIIPHELIKMKKLKELTLTGNNLTTTGIKPLYKMYWLTTLDLQANKITYVDKKIKSLKNLHVLHLSNNPLIILPDEILELKKLQWLGIGQLPNLDWDKTFKMLAQMPSLNKLSLFYDGFKTIPPGFEKLKQINFFIMNGNGISDQDEQRIKQMFPNATINLD